MKIAILDDYAGAALRLADWNRLGAEITVFSDTITDPAALVDRLAPFDVICLMRERTGFPAALIDALPNLKLIVTSGPKNAAIDVAAATARGIPVSGTQSRKTTTSELAMLMILALNRRLIPEVGHMATQGWQQGLGRDLAGLTLGLIGLGNIGAQMAVLGRAFGMDVIAWSQNLTDARAAEVGARRMDSLPALMAAGRRGQRASGAVRPQPRSGRGKGLCRRETRPDLRQHLARADRGHRRAAGLPADQAHQRGGPRRLRR